MPGDLVASVNEFTGSEGAPIYAAEYTVTGTRTQIIFNGPDRMEPDREIRDLLVGPGNAIYLYSGTGSPWLLRHDLGSGTETQQTFAGWSTINNATFGGLAQFGQYIYATDQQTFGDGTPRGIVRFDTLGGTPVRFANFIGPSDLNIGLDGTLYALHGENTVNDAVFKFDPITMAFLGTIPIQQGDNRAVAAYYDGSIFVADADGLIRHYSPTGVLLGSLQVGSTFFSDIDISQSGKIALGTGGAGEIVLTDISLTSATSFSVTSRDSGNVFVAWVPVPEPTSTALIALALGLVFSVRKRLG